MKILQYIPLERAWILARYYNTVVIGCDEKLYTITVPEEEPLRYMRIAHPVTCGQIEHKVFRVVDSEGVVQLVSPEEFEAFSYRRTNLTVTPTVEVIPFELSRVPFKEDWEINPPVWAGDLRPNDPPSTKEPKLGRPVFIEAGFNPYAQRWEVNTKDRRNPLFVIDGGVKRYFGHIA